MKIYTFGHGAQSFEEFLEKINQQNIDIIVDIREKPFSRYHPHFNRNFLEKKLGKRYIFGGDFLGGSAEFHNDLLEYIKNRGKNLENSKNKLFSLIDEKTRQRIFSREPEFSNNEKRKIWITENFLRFYVSPTKREKAIKFLKEKIFTEENKDKIICFLCSEKDYRFCHRYHLLEKDWLKEFPQIKQVFHLEEEFDKKDKLDKGRSSEQKELFK
ncbi:DUF488 domain-containing protein [bacterium]|nr:DUF488 domain-containing protein [bacterium]